MLCFSPHVLLFPLLALGLPFMLLGLTEECRHVLLFPLFTLGLPFMLLG